jgi:tetratricopeptide (TPR) repeat protein
MEPLPDARESLALSFGRVSFCGTFLGILFAGLVAPRLIASSPSVSDEKAVETAAIVLRGFAAGCAVNIDADSLGKTSPQGELALSRIAPGDHYLHVDCPSQPSQVFFVSPKPAERVELRPAAAAVAQLPLEAAEARRELTRLVQKAVQARTAGHQDEAIADLRRATQLDPENPDLHQELGITFLLLKDWERARVEYLEAIRHDPSEAESHNGLGYALEKLGDIQAAAKEFRIAMQLEPDDKTYQEHYTETILALEDQKEKNKKK